MANKAVLGKGLASLLPGAPPFSRPITGVVVPALQTTNLKQPPHKLPELNLGPQQISVLEIHVNPYQPRREFTETELNELSQSILANGIIQPLVVRKTERGYQLIAGERRLRAAKLAGLKQVPVVIRQSTAREALERQDLNCIDEALAYFRLMQEFSLKQEEISSRIGKDRATVANYLRLLRLPEPIINDLKRQTLSFGHGKALLSLEENTLRLRAHQAIMEKGLSVRDAEALVKFLQNSSETEDSKSIKPPEPKTPEKSRLASLAQELTRLWSARVEIRGTGRRGKIIFHYGDREELDRILSLMQNENQ